MPGKKRANTDKHPTSNAKKVRIGKTVEHPIFANDVHPVVPTAPQNIPELKSVLKTPSSPIKRPKRKIGKKPIKSSVIKSKASKSKKSKTSKRLTLKNTKPERKNIKRNASKSKRSKKF